MILEEDCLAALGAARAGAVGEHSGMHMLASGFFVQSLSFAISCQATRFGIVG